MFDRFMLSNKHGIDIKFVQNNPLIAEIKPIPFKARGGPFAPKFPHPPLGFEDKSLRLWTIVGFVVEILNQVIT